MRNRIGLFLFALLLLNASAGSAEGNYQCEENLIEVMFDGAASVRLRDGELVDLAGTDVLSGLSDVLELTETYMWERLFELPEEELDRIEFEGEALSGCDVYNMNNIYRLRYEGEIDVWELAEKLQELPGIIRAMPVPLPQPLPLPPDYQNSQGYLKAASFTPTGIDAIYAWTQGGGDGTGVTVCDLEYSWNYNHNDILKAAGSQINSYVQDPFADNNHGTAVLGEMLSDYNGWGTTGICHGASLKTCGTYYGSPAPSWNVAGAMAVAISNLSAGDVILIEQQWEYVSGSYDYVPIEWWGNTYPSPQSYNAVYAAIQNATAVGIHVVEAGGNAVNGGGVNMDLMTWLGDTGAIICGAGGVYPGGTWPGGDLQRLFYSNYGSRFTSHAWGENVVSTGYGTLYNAQGTDYFYTASFSGTSSASPIVAGALACCVGYWVANGNPASALTPTLLRNVLANTGTMQVTPPTGSIGTRPNLAGAFGMLYSVGIEYSRGSGGFEGTLYVSPNPSRGSVRISFMHPDGIQADRVDILDSSGRIVELIEDCNGVEFLWDCRDAFGGSVPSGLYFAVAELQGDQITTPFVVLGD